MKLFTSLEELNQFLTEELGLPPIPEDSISNFDEAIGFKARAASNLANGEPTKH